MNNRTKAVTIIGVLIILFSIFLYFMIPAERITIVWVGMIFILLAEVIFFGGLILIEYLSRFTSQIFLRILGGSAIIVIPVVSIIVSLVCMITKSEAVNTFIIIQVSLIVIIVIFAVITYYASLSIKKKSDNVLNSISVLNSMIGRLNLLSSDINNTKYSALICKVEDELKYSDISSAVPSDEKLEAKLVNLENELLKDNYEGKDKEISELLDEMLNIVKHRKIELRDVKKGVI